jgi:hypothetical protein
MIAAGKFGEGIGNAGGYLIQTIMIGDSATFFL